MNFPLSLIFRSLFPAAVSIILIAAGCSSDQPGHRPGGPSDRRASAAPLAGRDTFFNGQITAALTVGRGPGFAGKPMQEGEEPGPEHRRHGGGGGFQMGGGAGGGGHGERRRGGDDAFGGEEDEMPSQAERRPMSSMRHAATPNPPVMIHLSFTNNGTTHADLLIADFLSPLGNFVVTPGKLSLDPGQTLEVEPMTSRLAGEISGAAVTLALRLNGQGEKKTIQLVLAPVAKPATPPAGK